MDKETEALIKKIAELIGRERIRFASVTVCLETADQILQTLKEAGGVFLHPDQNLPEAPLELIDKMVEQKLYRSPYVLAQQDMLKANFRKIGGG